MMTTSNCLVAFLLMIGSCACSGGDDKNDEPAQADIASACEETCLEEDACDTTLTHPDGYCASECSAQAQHSSDIGCANEYFDLVTCQAGSNECPTPSCLEETRSYENCVPEGQGDACDQFCFMMETTCMSETDTPTCESDCQRFRQLGEQAGCPGSIDRFLECRVDNSACTLDDITNSCWSEASEYDGCLNN